MFFYYSNDLAISWFQWLKLKRISRKISNNILSTISVFFFNFAFWARWLQLGNPPPALGFTNGWIKFHRNKVYKLLCVLLRFCSYILQQNSVSVNFTKTPLILSSLFLLELPKAQFARCSVKYGQLTNTHIYTLIQPQPSYT